GKYIVAFTDSPNTVILQNMRYLPRAYPVHQVIVEKNKYLALNTLDHPQFRPTEMVVLEEEPPFPPPPSLIPSSASKVNISRYYNDEITIQAEMAQDGFLVLSEKYYPGWKAYVDGKSEKIYKANSIMRAVYLSKGNHTIKFVFDPWAYKVGLWLSSITFLFLIGAVVWRVRRRTGKTVNQR
ncbi:MAG: YfhO family protein, partial [Deltaproteobacteria bacterium]